MAQNLIRKQSFPAAIEAAKIAHESCTTPKKSVFLLGRAQMLSGAFAEAEKTFTPLVKAFPGDMQLLIALGQDQYLAGEDVAAESSLQKAVAASPSAPEPHYWLARLEYQEKRYPQAIAQFHAALQEDPHMYTALDGLGLCYEAMGDMSAAQDAFAQAIALVHAAVLSYDQAYADDAALMLKLHKTQTAFELAAEGAQRNPSNPHEFYLAAAALEQAGLYERSVQWLQQAVRLDPKWAEPHYLMARLYRRLGRDAKAEAESASFAQLRAAEPAQPR